MNILPRSAIRLALISLLSLAGSQMASAVNIQWLPTSGTSNWSNNASWGNGTGPIPTSADTALFQNNGNTTQTLTANVDGNYTVNKVQIQTNTGKTGTIDLTLSGTNELTVSSISLSVLGAGTSTATFATNLTLTGSGAKSVAASNPNTFLTFASGSTLTVASGTTLQAAGTFTAAAGGTINLNSSTFNTGNNTVALRVDGGTVNWNVGTFTSSSTNAAQIQLSGLYSTSAAAPATLNFLKSYSSGGGITLGYNASSNNSNVSLYGTANNVTIASNMTTVAAGTGGLGNNTFIVGANDTAATSGSPTRVTFSGNYTATDTNARSHNFFAADNNTAVFSGVISGINSANSSTVTKTGNGTVSFNGTNTYTATTTITGGKLVLGNALALQNSAYDTTGSTGAIGLDVTGYATPTLGGLAGSVNLATAITGYGSVTGLTLNPQSGNSNTYSGVIANGSGNMTLTKTGAGTQTLAGANTYTGGTTVSAGTLTFLNTTAQPSSGNVTVAAGATLGLGVSGANAFTSANVDSLFAGTLSNVTNNATSNVGIDTTNGNFTYSSNVPSTTRGLVKLGANTLTLTGNNSYNGRTFVQTGTLSFTTGNSSATGIQSLGTNASLDLGVASISSGTLTYNGTGAATLAKNINVLGNGGDTIQNSGTGLLTLNGTITKNGTTLTLKGGSNGIRVTGAIGGSNASSDLVIDGGNTTLSSANTYNGPTYIINGATLTANVTGALPTTNGRTTLIMDQTGSGASTLTLGANQTIASLTGNTTSTVSLNANTLTIGTASANTTYAGVLTGTGSLIKDSASTLTLSGNNTFSGTTTVNGTLELKTASGSALGQTSSITVNSGGTLLLSQSNQINNSANMTLAGGAVKFGSVVTEGSNGAVGLGALTLSANSTLDFNSLAGTITFSTGFTSNGFKLAVTNWVTGSHLYFNQDESSFLSSFTVNGLAAQQFNVGGSFYEIVAVPEPGTIAAGLALLGLIAWRERRRFRFLVRG